MNNTYLTPMRNARRWMMCLALMLCVVTYAQNKIEYFWNTDPGIGKGTKVAVTNGMVNLALETNALPAGPNLLGIRAIDGDHYSTTLLRTIFKMSILAEDAKIEYFWDSDPGVGNATDYPVELSGSDATVSIELPTTGMSDGVHLLGMRVYNGDWSHTYHRLVAIASDGTIERIEYFWDEDPGVGNATEYEVNTQNGSAMVSLEIPTDTLGTGVHLLGIRSLCGKWSNTLLRYVAVSAKGGAIERVEYFWDEDPGVGNATEYEVNANSGDAMASLEIPTDTLGTGVHLLGIRSLCGKWSSTLLRYVAVSAKGGDIERVEYYWDTDPGYGQATELPFSGDTLAIVDTEIVPPTDYGTHVLHIRAYSNGMWSTPYIQKFCMNATPLMEIAKDTVCVGEQFIVYNMTTGATESTTYSWDMNGDGKEDATYGEEFVYSYSKAGTYMASLSVKTVGDCTATCYVPIVVLPTDAPKVTLSASTKTVCEGEAVRLKATATNAGGHPEYEWLLNDEVIANTLVDTLMLEQIADYDKVKVRVISSNPCASVDNVLSSQITLRVKSLPEVSIAHYFPVYTSEEAMILSGGMPTGGTYYIDGKETSLFNPKRNEAGTYQLTYSYTNSDGCTSEAVTSIVLREEGENSLLKGDVNKDETVDVMDVLCEVDLIYGRTFPSYTLATADINDDKTVNVADIVGISGIILGKHAPVVQSRSASAPSRLAGMDAHADDVTEVRLHFKLSTSQTVCGLQFDVTMPEGVELVSDTQGLVVGRKEGTEDNTYTLLVYSSSLDAVPNTLTVKATLPINISEGVYPIVPTNLVLADASMRVLPHTIGEGKLFVGGTTGMTHTESGIRMTVEESGIRIKGASGTVTMLTDAVGRFVLAEELADDDCLIPLSSLSAGFYVIEIVNESRPAKVKFLWK